MKVKLGFPLTHLVGSVAGTVFQNSQGGLMARTKSYPIGLGSLTTSNVVSLIHKYLHLLYSLVLDLR